MDTALSRRSILSRRKICSPKSFVWPAFKDDEDNVVKEIIERIFRKHKDCMIAVSKQNSKKDGNTNQLTNKQKEEKKKFKSTFVLGFNAIIRRLEKDQLRLVLMNKSIFPPVLKKAVLSLAVEQECLAVAISDLVSPIQSSWKAMKSVTCLGVMKTEGHNEFDELVNFIREKLPQQQPSTSVSSNSASDCDERITDRDIKETATSETNKRVDQGEKKQSVVHVRPSVDFTRYYRERTQSQLQQKSFGGENFISLEEDTDEIIVFQNGKKVTEELHRDKECYGIKPILTVKSSVGLLKERNSEAVSLTEKSNNMSSTGKEVSKSSRELDSGKESFGVKPGAVQELGEESQRGVKREFESLTDGSGYRSITVKQLKLNENKQRKNKKMKRDRNTS